MEGWIKVSRRLLEWEWFSDKQTLQLYMYLSLSASTSDKRWRGIEIKRGQLVTSVNSICADLKNTKDKQPTTVQSIRTNLKRLEEAGAIKRETTNKYTVITICNYGSPDDSATGGQQASNKQATNKQQTKPLVNQTLIASVELASNKQATNSQQTSNKQTTNKTACKSDTYSECGTCSQQTTNEQRKEEERKKEERSKEERNKKERKKEQENPTYVGEKKCTTIVVPLSERVKAFYNSLIPFVRIYGSEMLREFFDYWTEPTPGGRKFRKELERTWDTKRRLSTWAKRTSQYGTNHYTSRQDRDKEWAEHVTETLQANAESDEIPSALRDG